MTAYSHGIDFAKKMDAADPLKEFRRKFHIPKARSGGEAVYFCGNSLGPMPKALPAAMKEQLDGWARMGVEGHWTAPCDWLPTSVGPPASPHVEAGGGHRRREAFGSRGHGNADRQPSPPDDQLLQPDAAAL